MLNPELFYNELINQGITFFTGVPDSLLKDICAVITEKTTEKNHIIAANEGNAIGLAAGYHLATGNIPLVYFQNSGLGNATNPLLSLAAKEVYGIPMLLMIGWRGEPGTKDEPQHVLQGAVQNALLDDLQIPYAILDNAVNNTSEFLTKVILQAKQESKPVAIVVKKEVFSSYELQAEDLRYEINRDEAIGEIITSLNDSDIVVSTTGKTSRELYEHRLHSNTSNSCDFLTVGSMGHASSIALGIALNTSKKVICLDGDGAALMHMGAFSTIGNSAAKNFIHILLNNGAHDSVGGQPTLGFDVDFQAIALACGYKKVVSIEHKTDIQSSLSALKQVNGPVFLEIKINKGAREDLSRPKESPETNKRNFMKGVKG